MAIQIVILLVLLVGGGGVFFNLMRRGQHISTAMPQKRLRQAKTAHEALPQITIMGNLLRTGPGAYHAYIDVDLAANFYLLDAESQRASVMKFHELLMGNPTISMQIALPSLRTDLRDHEARLRETAAESAIESNQRVLLEMADWLKAVAQKHQPLHRGRYIVLNYQHTPPRKGEDTLSEARIAQRAQDALEHEVGRVLGSLDAMGCSARMLTGGEIAQLLWQTLDRDRARVASMEDITAQGHGNFVTVSDAVVPPLTMRDSRIEETSTPEMLSGRRM